MKPAGDITKRLWIDLAISINEYHVAKLKEDYDWRIQDTARELRRSYGSVQQYLAIASWIKTHENQLRRLETMKEAVAWIKAAQRKRDLGESV